MVCEAHKVIGFLQLAGIEPAVWLSESGRGIPDTYLALATQVKSIDQVVLSGS